MVRVLFVYLSFEMHVDFGGCCAFYVEFGGGGFWGGFLYGLVLYELVYAVPY